MAPTRYSVLALLALSSSTSWALPHEIRDDATRKPWPPHHSKSKPLPPVLPTPSNAISLSPPSYSISFDTPESSNEPVVPPAIPLTSNFISLSPPRYSVSWDLGSTTEDVPTPTPTPQEPSGPDYPPSYPSNQISLSPPSASISFENGQPAQTADPALPPTYSVSWNRRQFEEDPEPTGAPEPEDPQDPDGPIIIPPLPPVTPPNSIGLPQISATVIWGKEKEKRDIEAAAATNSIGFQFPSVSFWWPKPTSQAHVSWGKRQDDDGPTEIPPQPQPTPPNQISILPPQPSISWGKRQYDEDEPQETDFPTPEEPFPGDDLPLPPYQPPNSIGLGRPTATVIWGKNKREAEANAQGNSWGIVLPTAFPPWPWYPPPKETSTSNGGYISWGRDAAPEPTGAGVSWDYPKPPKSTKSVKSKSSKKTTTTTSSSTQNGWISWGRRSPEITPAPEPVDGQYPKPSACALTTTVTRPVPCPLIKCPSPCQVVEASLDPEYAADEPSEPVAPKCPATVLVPGKCPTCVCSYTPLPPATATPTSPKWTPIPPGTPLPTKPHYTPVKPTPISKFTTSVKSAYGQ